MTPAGRPSRAPHDAQPRLVTSSGVSTVVSGIPHLSENARRQLIPGTIPYYAWTSAVDVDLQTALAISRASAEALMALSAQAAETMREKLEVEVAKLQMDASPESEASVRAIRQLLDKAA